FLLWMTAETPRNTAAVWQLLEAELTPADRLLHYFAYDALRGETETGAALRQRPAFVRNALVRLAFPEDFAAAGARFPDPDLAPFLLTVSSELLAVERQPTFWIGGLQGAPPPRLADQIETRRSALALLRQMNRFQEWERWARSVGPFDDGYRVAQLWLTDW